MLCHPTHSSPVSVHLPSNLYLQSLRALKDQASFRLSVNVCDPVGSCRWFFSCLNLVAVQLSKSVHEKRNRSKDKRAYTHFSTCLCGTGRYEKGGVKMVTLMLLYHDWFVCLESSAFWFSFLTGEYRLLLQYLLIWIVSSSYTGASCLLAAVFTVCSRAAFWLRQM